MASLGALLYHEGVAASTFGAAWPDHVALQVHLSEHDAWSELDVTKKLVEDAADADLYLYPGSAHLFTDATLADYDESAARLVLERSKDFLARWA
jgi:dienelactone hydrolase